jgi:haloalkane dehalogenase
MGHQAPDQVLSITALDTVVDVAAFSPPWPMRPFLVPGVGEAWLALMRRRTWRWLFRREGIADRGAVTSAEIDAYLTLMKRQDGGRAFLRIMRGFELSVQKQGFFRDGLAARPQYPTKVVWGDRDRMLTEARRRRVLDVLGSDDPVLVPARHFLQEDQAPAVVAAIASLVKASTPARVGDFRRP